MRGASRNPLVASYVVPFAVIRSMYTGGAILLVGRCCGSIALAPPKNPTNHIFPSEDLVIWEPWINPMGVLGTPSELSKTAILTFRRESMSHASNSVRAARTRPQVM